MVEINSMDDIDEDEDEHVDQNHSTSQSHKLNDLDDEDFEETQEDKIAVEAAALKLLDAVSSNDLRAAHEALEMGADVEFVFTESGVEAGFTALMAACYRGHDQMVLLLLRHGADPNYTNEAGEHTLFWAVDGGADVLRIVCDHGADVDALTSRGWSPLSYAVACQAYPRSYEPGITPDKILKDEYGATVFGAGPPSFWNAAKGVTVQDEDSDQVRTIRGMTSLDDMDDEDQERVVLPDALEASKEWEARSVMQAEFDRVAQEERELQEIMNDMNRNPFVKEKGRALAK